MKTSMIKSLKNNHYVVFAGWDASMQDAACELGIHNFEQLSNDTWLQRHSGHSFSLHLAYRLDSDYMPDPEPTKTCPRRPNRMKPLPEAPKPTTHEALQQNEKPFGLMSELLQNEAKRIGKRNFICLGVDGEDLVWSGMVHAGGPFLPGITYRLRPDYTPPEIKEPAAEVEDATIKQLRDEMTEWASSRPRRSISLR